MQLVRHGSGDHKVFAIVLQGRGEGSVLRRFWDAQIAQTTRYDGKPGIMRRIGEEIRGVPWHESRVWGERFELLIN